MNSLSNIRRSVGEWAAGNQKAVLFIIGTLVAYSYYPVGIADDSLLLSLWRILTILVILAFLISSLSGAKKPKSEHEEEGETNAPSEAKPDKKEGIVPRFPDGFSLKKPRDTEKDYDLFLEKILSIIKKTFAAHSALIYLYDKEKKDLQLKCVVSEEEDITDESNDPILTKDKSFLEELLVKGNSFLSNEPDKVKSALTFYPEPIDVASCIAAPIIVDEEVNGVLLIDSMEKNAYSDDDISLVETYGGIIAETIVNFNNLSEFEYSAQLFSFFYEVSRGLISNLKFEEILDLLLSVINEVIGYDRLTISEYKTGGNQAKIIRVNGQRDEFMEDTSYPLEGGLNGWVIRKCKPIKIADLEKDDQFLPRFTSQEKSNKNLRSFLGAPISYHDICFGVISVESFEPDNYGDGDEKILTMLANNFGVALERSHALQQLELQATTDELTKVFNYRYFIQRIGEEIERALRYDSNITLFLLDLDYFKQVNDEYGHLAGDRVLKQVAAEIKNSTRNVDFVCRYGGEEFSIVLVETGMKEALYTAERIRKNIESMTINYEDAVINITVSIGAVEFPNASKNYEKLINEADKALYQAKSKGRNCIVHYKEEAESVL